MGVECRAAALLARQSAHDGRLGRRIRRAVPRDGKGGSGETREARMRRQRAAGLVEMEN